MPKKSGSEKLSIKDYLQKLIKKKDLTPAEIVEAIKGFSKMQKEADEKEKLAKEQAKEKKLQQKLQEKQTEEIATEKPINNTQQTDDIGEMDLPLDYSAFWEKETKVEELTVKSASDALVASLNAFGRVDMEYIISTSGLSYEQVVAELKDAIFQNPETWQNDPYKGWETADQYLSGNLYKKWREANTASYATRGRFIENIRAINKVLPKQVAKEDIFITLGSPWVPADIIDEFIDHLFGKSYVSNRKSFATRHDEITGTWDIPEKNRYWNSSKVYSTYGTRRLTALYIIEKTLNMRNVAVTDEAVCLTNKSGKKRVINQAETLSAIEKQKKIVEEFKNWVWRDKKRTDRLIEIYEEKYSHYRTKKFDGSFLKFPEMSCNVNLRQYQKDAVARILFSPNTLLAHDVGTGKTFIMIASGMELKRMGLSKKNLYVVPNNLVGQWKKMFLELYPKAKVLGVSPKEFTPSKRQDTLKEMRDGDYDGIVIASSCFDLIPLSHEYYEEKLKERKELLDSLSAQMSKDTSGIKNEKKKLQKELQDLAVSSIANPINGISFDQLGVTRLFVDEAHNYKNLCVSTKTTNVLGLSTTASQKCEDMLDKVRHVQSKNGGVILATGTPVTNSITDIFVMQYYLQYGELELLDLQSFDSWIGMFAEKQTEFEIDVDTSKYRMATRFSKFHNLPELTSILSSIADFHQVEGSEELPETDGYIDALIGKTPAFKEYLNKISARADAVRSRAVKRTEDNMLKITIDGRQAALDLRLVDDKAYFDYQSKVARCAENVADIYFRTQENKSSQLIFCDTSTPKAGFNIYDELRKLLCYAGVPDSQIAYVHDATTEKKRDLLFERVSDGDIRILIGSTAKLGLGVNVQKRLIALHHLDIPWRPADMVQREGRIIRPGNLNKKVQIFRYITEGSFDAYSWQLLESKQRFISAILSGSIKERSGSDISDTVLNYAEVKALAIGNPLIKQRVELSNELSRMYSLKRKYVETRHDLQRELSELPQKIEKAQGLVNRCSADARYFASIFVKDAKKSKEESEERANMRKTIFDAVCENVMQERERYLLSYMGFDIVLPIQMPKEKPFIYVQRVGRYFVEIGEVEKGVMTRIDNCLESLSDRLIRLEGQLAQLKNNRQTIMTELAKDENYDQVIDELKVKLEDVDKKLGVNKNE